jgi:hypothetical protein
MPPSTKIVCPWGERAGDTGADAEAAPVTSAVLSVTRA